jgi:hypothetical protein
LVGPGDEEIGQVKRHQTQENRRYQIREQKPPETDPAAQNGNDLTVGRHFGGEKYDRNKGEKITEKVDKIGYEIEVIRKNDFLQRRFFFDEIINLLRNIEYNDNDYQQRYGKEKGPKKLFNDIYVDLLQTI